MKINGQDVNNLFLNGTRFKNIADDYFLPVGTEYYEYWYSRANHIFKLDVGMNNNGINSLTDSDFILNTEIFYDTPEKIVKNYRPDVGVEASIFIDSNAKFYSIDKYNTIDYVYLFTPQTFEKLKLSNFI